MADETANCGRGSPPTWTQRYKLGARVNQDMDHYCTLEELGQALGVTKQNAYTESVLALGTLVWAVCERLCLQPPGGRHG